VSAWLPQYLSASSHRTTPPQLFINVLPEMSMLAP
jgi:hypothetical protein